MEELQSDPIISFYVKMSKHTEYETVLPVYSETTLRLAFKHMLKATRLPMFHELRLYRNLLLLHYAETYKTEDDLQLIMRSCYTKIEVRQICAKRDLILQEWRSYSRDFLKRYLLKDTLFKILSEWKHRYESLYGKVNEEQLRCKVCEIQKILGFSTNFMLTYIKAIQDLLSNPNFKWTSQKLKSEVTHEDLSIENIYKDIKSSLWYMARESFHMESKVDTNSIEQQKPPVKRRKVSRITKATKDVAVTKTADRQVVATATASQQKLNVRQEYDVQSSATSNENTSSSDCNAKSDGFVTVTAVVTDSESDTDATDATIANGDDTRFESKPSTKAHENKLPLEIIDNDTAMRYITALQAYACMNDCDEALDLLDRVDTIFRTKSH